ncbi:MAG TPA: hypothetical protein VNX47_07760 [Nevskia sp.]|nr:hypothetical protein [Nevskia sp.]
MTPLLIGFGDAGIRAMKHQLVAARGETAAIAVGDDEAVGLLSPLRGRHPIHSAWLSLPHGLVSTRGWRMIFERTVLGLFETLRPLLQQPRMIVLYAELGALESGGTAALFAREITRMHKGHQLIANLMKPVPFNGAELTYLADVQLFTLGHCAMSMQIVAQERPGAAGKGFGYADAAAVVMWNEHLERAQLLLEATANQRRTEIGLVAMNGERVRRESKAA